jgi:hypothetical protein
MSDTGNVRTIHEHELSPTDLVLETGNTRDVHLELPVRFSATINAGSLCVADEIDLCGCRLGFEICV